jgi:hypothetical protein
MARESRPGLEPFVPKGSNHREISEKHQETDAVPSGRFVRIPLAITPLSGGISTSIRAVMLRWNRSRSVFCGRTGRFGS